MNLLDFLAEVEKRPEMYMAHGTCLRDLELMLFGYNAALRAHSIQNDLSQFNQEFGKYIFEKTNWSTSRGWAGAITRHSSSPELAVNMFFDLVNDFILLKQELESGSDPSK